MVLFKSGSFMRGPTLPVDWNTLIKPDVFLNWGNVQASETISFTHFLFFSNYDDILQNFMIFGQFGDSF